MSSDLETPLAESGIGHLICGVLPPDDVTPVPTNNTSRVGEVEVAVAVDENYENDAIFAMDEDHSHHPVAGNYSEQVDSDSDSATDVEEAEEEELGTRDELAESGFSDRFPESGFRRSGRFAAARPNTSTRLPSSSIAASLPVAISRGFWPLRETAADGDFALAEECVGADDDKTILPQRHTDIYERIVAYSRSIQPADDPERLFGERPRRRYRTGRDSTCIYDGPSGLAANTTVTPDSAGSADTPNASAVPAPTAEIGIVRSVMGGGGQLPLGMSIPLVARDLNATPTSQAQPQPLAGVAGDEMVLVGRLAGEVGTRPRIIVPASLPLHQI